MSKLDTLRESRTQAHTEFRAIADELDAALASRALTTDETDKLAAAEARVGQLDTAIAREETEEQRAREFDEERARKLGSVDPNTRVGHEPLTYGPGNPNNSWFRDVLASNLNGPGAPAARERLQHHQTEVDTLAAGSQETADARCATSYRQEYRRFAHETRADSTGLSSLGDWAPPIFNLDDYAPWRTYGRTFIDQMRSAPLPETGMVVNIPRVTTPTEAVNQTAGSTTQGNNENTTVSSQDMTGTYGSGTVQTIVNNAFVSQQYLDRFGPAGYRSDQMIISDQSAQTAKLLDQFAWGQVIGYAATNGASVAYTDSSFEAWKYKQAVHKAKAVLRKTDGVVTAPTHVFTPSDLWESVEGSYDANNRPLVVPQGVAYNPLAVGDSTNVPEGYTGFRFASLPSFVDENLWITWQASGFTGDTGYEPTLVADLNIGALWMESTPVIRVLPQPQAAQLTVLIQQYVYCALVPRYPTAFQFVVGTGTTPSYLL